MTEMPNGGTLVGERRPLPADSVVEMIHRQALTRPHAVAIKHGPCAMTYCDLWRRAAILADVLADFGVGQGDLVAVIAERSAETVAAMLAVMAIRAAYVPIDQTNPAERVRAVLNVAQPRVMLRDGHEDADSDWGFPVLDTSTVPDQGNPDPFTAMPRQDDIAYVIFTSGSTGVPKGVLAEHRSLVNYVCWCASLTGLTGSGSPLFSSLGFDLALTTLWVPLANGLPIIAIRNSWDYAAIFAERQRRYTLMKVTPSHARLFERLLRPDYRMATAVLMFGGEALEPSLVAAMSDRLADVKLVNHYGPTEATIGCCAYEFHSGSIPSLPSVPIGRPAWNAAAHVVDDDGLAARPGTHGELVISGVPVARGYLGHNDGGRFVDAAEFGGSGRAYRTGDIVEIRPGGVLLYLGRDDDQLKVNGYRIELAELSGHVRAMPYVTDVAFDISRGTVDRIEAFVVLDNTGSPPAGPEHAIRAHLTAVLPPTLVPHRIYVVPEIVFDANGKRDVCATRALAEAM
jgi:amino acid adenylation domain-containing protein